MLFLSSLAVMDFIVSSYFNCIVAPCDYWVKQGRKMARFARAAGLPASLTSPHCSWSDEKSRVLFWERSFLAGIAPNPTMS